MKKIDVPDFTDDPAGCVEACGILDGMEAAYCRSACGLLPRVVVADAMKQAEDYGLAGNLAKAYIAGYVSGQLHVRQESASKAGRK